MNHDDSVPIVFFIAAFVLLLMCWDSVSEWVRGRDVTSVDLHDDDKRER